MRAANNSSHVSGPLLVRIATMEAVSVELGHLTNYVQAMGGMTLALDVHKCLNNCVRHRPVFKMLTSRMTMPSSLSWFYGALLSKQL